MTAIFFIQITPIYENKVGEVWGFVKEIMIVHNPIIGYSSCMND